MYSSAAVDIYDLLHIGDKNYAAEAAEIAAVIRRAHPEAQTLLDVACGTGEHARLLMEEHGFRADALDIHPDFVRAARAKLPHSDVFQADMISFQIPVVYDVVLCLFSSIGYARTIDRVERALASFAAHLAPRGLILVEPWFGPGILESGQASMKTAEAHGVSVRRTIRSEIEGRISRLHFDYVIDRAGDIERFHEVHTLGLFTNDEMLDCFARAGLQATHDPKGPYGRGLYTARLATQ